MLPYQTERVKDQIVFSVIDGVTATHLSLIASFLILPSFLLSFLPSFLPFTLSLTPPLSLSVGPRADSTQTLLSCLGLGELSVWPLLGPNRHGVLSKLQLLINRAGWWGQVIVQAIAGSIWHQPNCHKQSASFLYPRYQRVIALSTLEGQTIYESPHLGPLWSVLQCFSRNFSSLQQSAFWDCL